MEEIRQVDLEVGPILAVDHRLALARVPEGVLDQPIDLGSRTDRPTIDPAAVFGQDRATGRRPEISETFWE